MNDLANKIAREIMIVWRQLMSSDFSVNVKSNTTLEFSRLDTQAKIEKNDWVFDLFYNDYLQYIEEGRKPKARKVPIRPLIDWMKRNLISDDVRVAYAIRESIYKLGIPARPLLEPFENMLDERFEEKIFDEIFNTIITELDKYFNK
jgi:hypothetical protein